MENDWQNGIKAAVQSTSIAFLSTQGQTHPETSMVPFCIFKGEVLLHLSGLAKHSKNIEHSPAAGLMICTPETPNTSPLALPRISLQGLVEKVAEHDFESAKAAYLTKIPDAEPLFSFADFGLYQLNVSDIFWVGGFGKARKISTESWRKLNC